MFWILQRISYSRIALFQGMYYFLSGLWPLIDISSFLNITGPKNDIWLVHTTGLLIAVIGLVLISSGIRWKVSPEIFILALGSAFSLMAIEIYYVIDGKIPPIYLLDAFIQILLSAMWVSLRIRGGGGSICGLMHDPTLDKPPSE
jgi:hypothetical protein